MMVLAGAGAAEVRRKLCDSVCGTTSGAGDDEGCWAEVSLDAL